MKICTHFTQSRKWKGQNCDLVSSLKISSDLTFNQLRLKMRLFQKCPVLIAVQLLTWLSCDLPEKTLAFPVVILNIPPKSSSFTDTRGLEPPTSTKWKRSVDPIEEFSIAEPEPEPRYVFFVQDRAYNLN